MTLRRRTAALAGGRAIALAALAAVLVAAPASADSIVYVKDSNVWLANPDGSGQYQVTTTGTAENPWRSPSQADDGTIVAIQKGDLRLHRMLQNGQVLSSIETPAPNPPVQAAISPNGQIIAYSFTNFTNCGVQTTCFKPHTQYSHADRFTDDAVFGRASGFNDPAWIGNDRTVVSDLTNWVWTDPLPGSSDESQWWADGSAGGERDLNGTPVDPGGCCQPLWDVDVAAARDKVAAVRRQTTVRFYGRTPGDPFAQSTPPAAQCDYGPAAGKYDNPSWAPDGSALAVADDSGITIVPTPSFADCRFPAGRTDQLILPGGSEPEWGPADVNPGPRAPAGGGSPGGGTGTAPGGGTGIAPGGTTSPAPAITAARSLGSVFRAREGFRFSVTLSAPAVVQVAVETVGSRRSGASRRLGTVRFRGRAGKNTFVVKKVRGKRLRPGRYRARVVAVAGSARSPARTLRFSIRR